MFYSNINVEAAERSLPPAIKRALEYIHNNDFSKIADGKYEIEGTDIYAQVQTCNPKKLEDIKAEYHINYIDLQYIPLDDDEMIGYGVKDDAAETVERMPELDLYFTSGIKNESFVHLRKGDYVLFYPTDLHRPCCIDIKDGPHKKVVVKIKNSLI